MRTTLTLDDTLAAKLKELATRTGRPFKEVVNETLRAGLSAQRVLPPVHRYGLRPAPMGRVAAGVDLDRALALADALEHGAELYSADHDFGRFPGLVHVDPLV